MARSLNRWQGIGRLGKEPEPRNMPNGKMVLNLSIAVDDGYKDREGNKVDRTEWVNIVAFDKTAEIMAEYLKKGSKIYVEGKLKTRKWEDQSGTTRYTTEINVEDFQMLDGKPQDGGGQRQDYSQQQRAPAPATTGGDSFEDDDIPF